jgi:uncharacterized membrane protein
VRPLAAVGAVPRRGDLVKRGIVALGVGFPLAMAMSMSMSMSMSMAAAASVLFDALGLLSTAALDNLDQVDFIYKVGPFSFIVALLAGAAGMLALTSAKSASLVGVFISVTTVPAAAFAAVAVVEGRYTPSTGIRGPARHQCDWYRRRGGRGAGSVAADGAATRITSAIHGLT